MVINGEAVQIAGTISITDTTVTTYLYPHKYLEWDIIDKKERLSREVLDKGEYFLERNQITSYLVITKKDIYQYIALDTPIHINMTRKCLYQIQR